ncbi:MAG TPA: pantoate--beta-alanine ligase [Steroidobacteraceae bacterium]|nr:pantoate--beta-alanine ligase [Steroidobacteraceae bacterium]
MQIISTVADLRDALSMQRDIGLVPTLGNLHDGHLSLVQMARRHAGLVVVSIFVNPLQFGPNEDFEKYPRTFERDCELLAQTGCDIVFAPGTEQMYPEPQEYKVQPPTELADILEGQFRPGFFVGVATVVLKLFNMVRPRVAVFGKKDYQQLLVIQNMVRQLALPIEVVAGETVREAGGLALSSRNAYLDEVQRREAAQLYRTLGEAAAQMKAGQTSRENIERAAAQALQARGWRPDYVAIRRRRDLKVPGSQDPCVILSAARLGATRLIDNMEF